MPNEHAFALTFAVTAPNDIGAVTGAELRAALTDLLASISDEELVNACSAPFALMEIDDDGRCPECGEDGGTGCGMPGCKY